MQFTKLTLRNWRNFREVDLPLEDRLFIAGPNASGKSNLLDAFRFLRDIAKTGGGLQEAVQFRGGLGKIRCLAARQNPNVEIAVELRDEKKGSEWGYAIGIRQENRGKRRVLLDYEKVWKNGELILDRPDAEDKEDELRLTQTHAEQINANQAFRSVVEVFQKILYLHLVPQLVKFPQLANREMAGDDPFGINFLDRIMETPERTRRARLRKIEKALQVAVPELKDLRDVKDKKGIPHLEAVYQHWRPDAGRQQEDQFSDGTLRLIGLFWMLLDGENLLLLEEPELSLHGAIVAKLPEIIWKMQRSKKRQVFLSSHSNELFSDRGISPDEVALLFPQGSEGTRVELAADKSEIQAALDGGMTMAEAISPRTAPKSISQLVFDL